METIVTSRKWQRCQEGWWMVW